MTRRPTACSPSRRQWLRALGAALLLPESGMDAANAQRAATPASLLAALQHQAATIRQGGGRHRLYVFFDPNCPYCHQLYLKLRPLVAQRDLQVHWVVLGMLTASSAPKAAAILQAPDRLKAFETNENDYDFAANGQPGGGIEPARTIEPATRRMLDTNLRIYREHKLFGVPVMVWQRRGGGDDMYAGVPSGQQLQQLLASLA